MYLNIASVKIHCQCLYTGIKFQCNLLILISLIDDHVGSGKKSNMGYNWNEYIQRNNVEIKMLLWFITFLTFWTNLYSLYNISENVRHILKQNISSSKDLYTEYNRLNPIKSSLAFLTWLKEKGALYCFYSAKPQRNLRLIWKCNWHIKVTIDR